MNKGGLNYRSGTLLLGSIFLWEEKNCQEEILGWLWGESFFTFIHGSQNRMGVPTQLIQVDLLMFWKNPIDVLECFCTRSSSLAVQPCMNSLLSRVEQTNKPQ